MGKDRQEVNASKSVAAGTARPAKQAGKLVNFSPTKEQKALLAEVALPLEDAVSLVSTYLEDGTRASLGYSSDKQGFFLIIREGADDWRTAVSVSFWSSSVERCFTLAAFYLTQVNPEFPRAVHLPLFDNDW